MAEGTLKKNRNEKYEMLLRIDVLSSTSKVSSRKDFV
jgi:hypothetical protein